MGWRGPPPPPPLQRRGGPPFHRLVGRGGRSDLFYFPAEPTIPGPYTYSVVARAGSTCKRYNVANFWFRSSIMH